MQHLAVPYHRPPKYGWVRLHNGQAKFGCNESDMSWVKNCRGDTWEGEDKACVAADGHVITGMVQQFNYVLGIQ